MYQFMKKMAKKKQFRGLDFQKFGSEIEQIVSGGAQHLRRHAKAINVGGRDFQSYETRVVNKYMNQSGPGDYRVLVNGDQVALAVHRNDGGYKIMYR